MRSPFVTPRSGQNGLSRFVSWTSLPSTRSFAEPDLGMIISGPVLQDALDWREPGRTRPVTDGARDRHVGKLLARPYAAEQQAAAAHVAPADEIDRELQPFTKNVGEDVHVLRRRNAAEKHDLALGTHFLVECLRA